jgi:hypothetical protein
MKKNRGGGMDNSTKLSNTKRHRGILPGKARPEKTHYSTISNIIPSGVLWRKTNENGEGRLRIVVASRGGRSATASPNRKTKKTLCSAHLFFSRDDVIASFRLVVVVTAHHMQEFAEQ